MTERKASQRDEAIGQAAELVRIFRPRWDLYAVSSAIAELVDDGREFAGGVAAAIRAARDPEVRTPYASVFESHWDDGTDPDVTAYAAAVTAARETIAGRSARVRACDLCDETGYVDGHLCSHNPETEARAREWRTKQQGERLKPDNGWEVTEAQRAEALRTLEAHIAEHPELAAVEQ